MKKLMFLLVMIMVLSTFTGCGSIGVTSTEDATSKVVFYFIGDSDQPDKEEVYAKANELFKKEYGIDVQFNPIAMGVYNDKMNMIMASGEYYDVCWTSNWSNNYTANVDGGAYFPLDGLLEKNAPSVKSIFSDTIWNAVRGWDGKIYGVPIQQIFATSCGVFIPNEYYDEYSHYITDQPITSLAGFTPYMEAVTKLAPGKARMNIAFTTLMSIYGWESVAGTGICAIERNGDPGNVEVFNMYSTPEFREAVATRKSWTDKGYTTNGMTVGQSSEQTPQVSPLSIVAYKPGVEIMNKPAGYDVKAVQLTDGVITTSGVLGTLYAINANSKDTENSMKLIEVLNIDEKAGNLLTYGIEGKHYNKVGENVIKVVDNPGFKNHNWCVGNIFNLYVTDDLPIAVWEDTKKLNNESAPSRIIGFNLDLKAISVELNNCNSVTKEYLSIVQSGVGDTLMELDKMLSKLEQAGSAKVVAEVQRQVNEFIANK